MVHGEGPALTHLDLNMPAAPCTSGFFSVLLWIFQTLHVLLKKQWPASERELVLQLHPAAFMSSTTDASAVMQTM